MLLEQLTVPTFMLTPMLLQPIVMPSVIVMESSPPTLLRHAISCFLHIQSGWEGFVADSQMFHDARFTDFHIPIVKYYLANAGFPACDVLLMPYHGVWYHLAEWGCANLW